MNTSNPSRADLATLLRCDIVAPPTPGHAIVPSLAETTQKAATHMYGSHNDEKKQVQMEGVYEMSKADPPLLYMMIPSVPRENDEEYLLKVLASVENFPNDRMFVFNNGKPNQDHLRWEQARSLYPKIHFIRNEVQLPPGHPAAYNTTLPLPDEVQAYVDRFNDTEVDQARNDTADRKQWRRKECNDFLVMSRYIVKAIGDSKKVNASWIIFNQDDAEWKASVTKIESVLAMAKVPRVDLYTGGLVSVAFRGHFLVELIEFADLWCDFKPVDWMMWSFSKSRAYENTLLNKLVEHIGKISSRMGRVKGEKERMEEAIVKRREAAAASQLRRKKLLEQQAKQQQEAQKQAKQQQEAPTQAKQQQVAPKQAKQQQEAPKQAKQQQEASEQEAQEQEVQKQDATTA